MILYYLFPSNQIGHLIGRHGNIHKSIMEKTQARIHFRIVPYSISTRARCTDFNLDSFQSSPTVSALIIGTAEAIENATKVLEDLARTTQVCKIVTSRNNKLYLFFFPRSIFLVHAGNKTNFVI